MSVVDDFLKFLESPEGRASIEEMIRRDKIIVRKIIKSIKIN